MVERAPVTAEASFIGPHLTRRLLATSAEVLIHDEPGTR